MTIITTLLTFIAIWVLVGFVAGMFIGAFKLPPFYNMFPATWAVANTAIAVYLTVLA